MRGIRESREILVGLATISRERGQLTSDNDLLGEMLEGRA